MFIYCLLLDKTLWILLQIVKKVYRLLRDKNSRELYNFGGCVDDDGDNVLVNIKERWPLDRPVLLIFWFDSHGTLRHYLPIFIQQAFKGQSRYWKKGLRYSLCLFYVLVWTLNKICEVVVWSVEQFSSFFHCADIEFAWRRSVENVYQRKKCPQLKSALTFLTAMIENKCTF